uniref:DUF1287 domain-containing protein n=1 Tax=Agathobacter sp. TaxID=2021311 RepID=UPI004057A81B
MEKTGNQMNQSAYLRQQRIRKRKQRERQLRFRITVFLLLLLAGIGVLLYKWNVIPHPYYTNSDFGIADYRSSIDKDSDGIDDQTDILKGVRDYIATKPKYKSAYYDGGYPNDAYGVCTDVVANGLKAAGYDLRVLVDAHIRENLPSYDIEKPDDNIDFRRVRNLYVYFQDTAIGLTTDIGKIEEWQGGDIIVFKNHIGVISDKRNHNGVPFVIHHGSPTQTGYEQDILEGRDDIIGHFRIS